MAPIRGRDLDLYGCDHSLKNLCQMSLDDPTFVAHELLTDALSKIMDSLTADVANLSDTLLMFTGTRTPA